MRSGPTALRTAQRNLLPLPAIAAAAVKFGGAAMLKKVALSKVIQKVGPDKVLGELKTLNGRLRSSGGRYGADVADAAEDSLSALERSLTTLRGDERVGALWGWYSRLEKDNPTLAAAILKSWMETLPGAKWASALMGGSNTSNSGTSDTGSGSGRQVEQEDDSNASSIIRALRETHPAVFEEYHVVLVPRDRTVETDDARKEAR